MMLIKDVNDYVPVTRALAALQRIATNANCHLMAVHHNTKAGGDQGREILGSTAFLGRADCSILLDEDHRNRRSMYMRQRDGEDMEPTELKLHSDGWVTTGRTVSAAKSDEVQAEIFECLRMQSEPIDTSMIKHTVRHSSGRVGSALKILVTDGKIKRSGEGKRGEPYTYETV